MIRKRWAVLLVALIAAVGVMAWLYRGQLVVRFGGLVWLPVSATSPLTPTSLAIALRRPAPVARAGEFQWRRLAEGLSVAEVPVLVGAIEVDRLLMTRIDPKHYRISVANDPDGGKTIGRWMRDTAAIAVVNGSYYARDGRPATPARSNGKPLGPAKYKAAHGALVSRNGGAYIVDLLGKDWKVEFSGADDAMVSYPLLVDRAGASRVTGESGWLANRSFIAQTRDGQLMLGTTRDAFFTLDRLAEFLRSAPMDIAIALNLDGGPVACQAVAAGEYRRQSCGRWEVQVKNGSAWMLPPLWFLGDPPMPIAIVVRRKP